MLTNPKGTIEERQKHNETLSRCTKGDTMAKRQIKATIVKILSEEKLIDATLLSSIAEQIYKDNYGLSVIEELYNDPSISEIWVNGYDNIWIDRNGIKTKIPNTFKSDKDVKRVINLMIRFDKKNISPTNPRVECRMADGSRLTCMIPPTASSHI